jgi:hypothetical protein
MTHPIDRAAALPRRPRRSARALVARLAALTALALAMAGCGDDEGNRPELFPSSNQPPSTSIVNPRLAGEEATYNLLVAWSAYDEDGTIAGFEIAIDDTIGANPWTFTAEYDSLFIFESSTCCVPDTTIFPDGTVEIDSLFRDFHTLFVRAVDNEGMEDPSPDRISFNSTTITPETVILRGPRDFTVTAKTVIFEWEGRDQDGEIAGYQYRLISGPGYLELPALPSGVDDPAWTYVPADCTVIRLTNLSTSSGQGDDIRGKHRFAIVAVDNAGAAERTMDDIVNTRDWESVETIGGSLVITSNVIGSRIGINNFEGQVFEGTRLSFTWRGDASLYGGEIQCYSYAFDQREVFSACDLRSIAFPPGLPDFVPPLGSHTLFVRAFDDAGQTIESNFTFVVLRGPRDILPEERRILVIDDFDDGDGGGGISFPEDPTEDAFWDSLLVGYQYGRFQVEDIRDIPTPRLIGAASTLIWYTDVESALQNSNNPAEFKNPIGPYIGAGGNLILCGTTTTDALTPDNSWNPQFIELPGCPHGTNGGRSTYSPVPWLTGGRSLDWFPAFCDSADNFVYDFLKVSRSFNDDTASQLDSIVTTGVPLPGGAVVPTLGVEWAKRLGLSERFGLTECEFYELRDAPGVVPLWEFMAVDGGTRGIAGLYVPADPARGRGHIVLLGFPPYFFNEQGMREAFRAFLDAFGEARQ